MEVQRRLHEQLEVCTDNILSCLICLPDRSMYMNLLFLWIISSWTYDHASWQVQRHLQLRIEAQGKYMQSILEKACQTLAGENMAAAGGGYNNKGMGNHQGVPDHHMGSAMKDFGSLNFPQFQDLNIYGGTDQIDLQHGFMPNNNDNICLGKKGLALIIVAAVKVL